MAHWPDGESAPAVGELASAASPNKGSGSQLATLAQAESSSYRYQLIYWVSSPLGEEIKAAFR